MTPAQRRWIQTIHVAKKQLKLTDEMYQAILTGAAGVTSSTQIKTWQQYEAVLAALKASGFVPAKKSTVSGSTGKQGTAGNRLTYRQEHYIQWLWQEASRQKDEHSLRAIVKNITGVDDIAFLTRSDATKVIIALRQIAVQQGINPDSIKNQFREDTE